VCGFNIAALAEWSWNFNGRSEKEFAAAWATRSGYANPDKVAGWSELMGAVEWDVYDSGFPECYAWGRAIEMIKARTKPVLGEGMFRYYATLESFDAKLVNCDKALDIATSFKNPDLANETKVVHSYIQLAKAIYQIAESVSALDAAKPEIKKRLADSVEALKRAGTENVMAIKAWQAAIGPEPWHPRVLAAIKATETTVHDICQSVEGPVEK